MQVEGPEVAVRLGAAWSLCQPQSDGGHTRKWVLQEGGSLAGRQVTRGALEVLRHGEMWRILSSSLSKAMAGMGRAGPERSVLLYVWRSHGHGSDPGRGVDRVG